jgi:hypothetical protein
MKSKIPATARRRQRCHDLRAAGKTTIEIAKAIGVTDAMISYWLSKERPTDEDVAALDYSYRHPKPDRYGCIRFNVRLEPDLFVAFRDMAEREGVSHNSLVETAVRIFLETNA